MVWIIMGVSGSGKTTIGRILAKTLRIGFHDADDYHPANNIVKMVNSVPLDDADRQPWLFELARNIARWNRGKGAVLACSALREKYRRVLSRDGKENVTFIHLQGDEKVISERMKSRNSHFFPSELLASQFRELEAPANAITVEIDRTPDEICSLIIGKLAVNGLLP